MARSDRSPLARASCFAALRTTLVKIPGDAAEADERVARTAFSRK